MKTFYPIESQQPITCAIDLDAIRRIALRAPMLGDPLAMSVSTLLGRLDRLVEQTSLNRVLVIGHALAEIARRDPSAAEVFKSARLAGQIRAEVEARKAGRSTEFEAPLVRHTTLVSASPGATQTSATTP